VLLGFGERYRGFSGHYGTVCQDTNEVLGVVGECYLIVQNEEASRS
jgi:hypothetical protein